MTQSRVWNFPTFVGRQTLLNLAKNPTPSYSVRSCYPSAKTLHPNIVSQQGVRQRAEGQLWQCQRMNPGPELKSTTRKRALLRYPQATYSYFSADLRLKVFLYYSEFIAYDISLLEYYNFNKHSFSCRCSPRSSSCKRLCLQNDCSSKRDCTDH